MKKSKYFNYGSYLNSRGYQKSIGTLMDNIKNNTLKSDNVTIDNTDKTYTISDLSFVADKAQILDISSTNIDVTSLRLRGDLMTIDTSNGSAHYLNIGDAKINLSMFKTTNTEERIFKENVKMEKLLEVSGVDISNNLTVSKILTVDQSAIIVDLSVVSITLGGVKKSEWPTGSTTNNASVWNGPGDDISYSKGNVIVHKRLDASGLDVSNNAKVQGTLTVTKDATFNSLVDVSGMKVNNNLTVDNNLIVKNNLTVNEKLTVINDASFHSLVDVSGMEVKNNLTVDKNLTVNEKLIVTKDASFNSLVDVSGLVVNKDLKVNGNLTVDGNLIVKGGIDISGSISFYFGGNKYNLTTVRDPSSTNGAWMGFTKGS